MHFNLIQNVKSICLSKFRQLRRKPHPQRTRLLVKRKVIDVDVAVELEDALHVPSYGAARMYSHRISIRRQVILSFRTLRKRKCSALPQVGNSERTYLLCKTMSGSQISLEGTTISDTLPQQDGDQPRRISDHSRLT